MPPFGESSFCNYIFWESGSKFREWIHLINEQNQKHKQHTDMKQELWRLGKKPKGETYKGQVIKEVMSPGVIMCVTLVTGVRPNEQPGYLEAGEEAHVTIPHNDKAKTGL